jgi:hypothetical protein
MQMELKYYAVVYASDLLGLGADLSTLQVCNERITDIPGVTLGVWLDRVG